jgi:seryl-tRNA synthetase
MDEDDIEILEPSQEELDEFKTRVAEWTKLDDQVRKLIIAVKERRTHQKALSDGIQVFMTKYGYDNLNTNYGRIIHSVRKVKQPLKINEIKDLITKEPNLSGEELIKAIFHAERPTVEKQMIRRVIPKVSMSLDF